MIPKEQAEAELKRLTNRQWVDACLEKAENHSSRVRGSVRKLIKPEGHILDTVSIYSTVPEAGAQVFKELDANARKDLFAILFPGMEMVIERGWKSFQHLPYQDGWGIKPFRAPQSPEVLLSRQASWVVQLTHLISPLGQTLRWLAAWAPHLSGYHSDRNLGILFGAAISAGGSEGDAVFDILSASARGEHEIGGMGSHITRAFLSSNRVEAWEFVERMLLAAQREEGLRQVILESIDEGHPEAFRRMLKLILSEDLIRFSATVRAVDTWLGYQWSVFASKTIVTNLEKLSQYLEDTEARTRAIEGGDAEESYLSLWSLAFENAPAAIEPANRLLDHPQPERRYVAVKMLEGLQLSDCDPGLLKAIDDQDLRVSVVALGATIGRSRENHDERNQFELIERQLPRYPMETRQLEPIVWPWAVHKVSRSLVANQLASVLGQRSPVALIPHLAEMDVHPRSHALMLLGKQKSWDATTRATLLEHVGHVSPSIRTVASEALESHTIQPDEAVGLEALLGRKSGDLRRSVLSLLARQPDIDALASARRLLKTRGGPLRLAGVELLRMLAEAKRSAADARLEAEAYQSSHSRLTDAERQQLEVILAVQVDLPRLDNALGLLRHEDRTWPEVPRPLSVQFSSPAAESVLLMLLELIQANLNQTVTIERWQGETWTGILGDNQCWFPIPDSQKGIEVDRARLPLAEAWEKGWMNRGPECRDFDGFELIRAIALCASGNWRTPEDPEDEDQTPDYKSLTAKMFPPISVARPARHVCHILTRLLGWLARLFPVHGESEFLLDALEGALALVPKTDLLISENRMTQIPTQGNDGTRVLPHDHVLRQIMFEKSLPRWRSDRANGSPFVVWLNLANSLNDSIYERSNPDILIRLWRLNRWVDEPMRSRESGGGSDAVALSRCLPRMRASLRVTCLARQAGGATDADVIDLLLSRRAERFHSHLTFAALSELTGRKPHLLLQEFSFLTPLVEKCRQRILEIELKRGEQPTAASAPALSLRSVWGCRTVAALLRALGKGSFTHGWIWNGNDRYTVFSGLIQRSFPYPTETPADFAQACREAGLSETRLIELAVYAPQWVTWVGEALGWKGLTEAVWWVHAHTKGTDWHVDGEIRELWQADMGSRTALSSSDLLEGAVDVDWFHRSHQSLGDERWSQVYSAAKHASTGAGHSRARLFADAMLGNISEAELKQRIDQKRNQDALRALGLLPLAAGEGRDDEILSRYQTIQEFRRSSKQFGSQRQVSEKRAAQISQQNLARTAGFADPIRLEWAMEAKAVEDLAEGPIQVVIDGVVASLGIDPWGEIEMEVTRDGKVLADIPAKLKKNPQIEALRKRKVELKRQTSRIRPSLEQFMTRADAFTGLDLCELMKHPMLAPFLANLVLIGDGIWGYPIHDGRALENHRGGIDPVKPMEKVRIAHPLDLLPSAEWHQWQKNCFARERVQPFKQVFRELYPLTEAEKSDGIRSHRYEGHQVNPKQAMALLGQRGWLNHPEEGVLKTYHEAGIIARLKFQEGFLTPAQVEGLTFESVSFTSRKSGELVPLIELPPRLFSEAMRDLDLVVSVAHCGGVDPEASASTIEMRGNLVTETCRLLRLENVEVKDRYVRIRGTLAEYAVHLGSAITQKMPGESLFIVPVHGQHRGRLFLPFADADPKSAEVMSKVLLLARDREIKDPTILNQICGE